MSPVGEHSEASHVYFEGLEEHPQQPTRKPSDHRERGRGGGRERWVSGWMGTCVPRMGDGGLVRWRWRLSGETVVAASLCLLSDPSNRKPLLRHIPGSSRLFPARRGSNAPILGVSG